MENLKKICEYLKVSVKRIFFFKIKYSIYKISIFLLRIIFHTQIVFPEKKNSLRNSYIPEKFAIQLLPFLSATCCILFHRLNLLAD